MKEYHFVKKRKQFLRGGYYYRGSSTPASRFRTKKSRSPSYQNLPYTMLKRRFAFLYASTSLHKKTLTVASNRNFESFLPIRCVAPQRILQFFAAGFAFAFAFGNSARYCVVLLNAPLSDREKKKKLSAMGLFSREILIHCHWRQEVPLSYWFASSGGEIIFWRGASCLRIFMNWNLALDFGRNTTTLSEFIGYIDLIDFRQIFAKTF